MLFREAGRLSATRPVWQTVANARAARDGERPALVTMALFAAGARF